MQFFSHSSDEDGPTPEQIASWARRMNPPDNEVPGAVPWSALLGRSADVAVALVGAHAYSTGIQLGVAVRARSRGGDEDLHQGVHGYSGRGVDRLLLGVEYPDGRVATNARSSWPPQAQPDDQPSLHSGASSGGSRGVNAEFFLSPLPPAGPLTIVCAWPSRGILETRTVLDGAAALAEAVTKIQVLWPVEIDPPPEPAQPPPPNVPQGGWFDAILRSDPQ